MHYTYFIILLLCVAGPLALSFDKKVAFYKKWKFVFPAMIFPAFFFIVWDIFFTSAGVWSFNENYICGIKLFNIPVEEALFFFVVPYCCTFIYECIRCYFPELKNTKGSNLVLANIASLCAFGAVVYYDRAYTFYTGTFNAMLICIILLFRKKMNWFNGKTFLFSYLIILLPFLAVNGVLTSWPVVIYNNAENVGKRIFTIPFEDIFYGMLLVLGNIVFFEKLRHTPVA